MQMTRYQECTLVSMICKTISEALKVYGRMESLSLSLFFNGYTIEYALNDELSRRAYFTSPV